MLCLLLFLLLLFCYVFMCSIFSNYDKTLVFYFSGFSNFYNGTALATLHDVVVVSINYRLGPFGMCFY